MGFCVVLTRFKRGRSLGEPGERAGSSPVRPAGHTFNFHVSVNGAGENVAAQVKQALRSSGEGMIDMMRRAERADFRRAIVWR